jgi:hypothetical protein
MLPPERLLAEVGPAVASGPGLPSPADGRPARLNEEEGDGYEKGGRNQGLPWNELRAGKHNAGPAAAK